jgi:hypothetical protein
MNEMLIGFWIFLFLKEITKHQCQSNQFIKLKSEKDNLKKKFEKSFYIKHQTSFLFDLLFGGVASFGETIFNGVG